MLLFDIGKVCRTKFSPNNKYDFASFNNDRALSLDDKTKDYVDRNTGGRVIRHTTRVICTVKICIFERSNEKNSFLEN